MPLKAREKSRTGIYHNSQDILYSGEDYQSYRLGKAFIILLALICLTGSLAGCSELKPVDAGKHNNSEQAITMRK
jgi:hypothetical protein